MIKLDFQERLNWLSSPKVSEADWYSSLVFIKWRFLQQKIFQRRKVYLIIEQSMSWWIQLLVFGTDKSGFITMKRNFRKLINWDDRLSFFFSEFLKTFSTVWKDERGKTLKISKSKIGFKKISAKFSSTKFVQCLVMCVHEVLKVFLLLKFVANCLFLPLSNENGLIAW